MTQTSVEILQALLRFDTTNPPGNEYLVATWVRDLLAEAGIESTILAKDPERPNLIAQFKGDGKAPPLLLQGHMDVVSTAGQNWTYSPFGGEIHDGYIWGRGTLDMKGGIAMMLSALIRAQEEQISLPGDVILCLVADEEAGGEFGAGYLVDEHAAIFEGVRYALGEIGGFSMKIAGRTFYPIMVSEKQTCWMKLTLRGPGGHGSTIQRGGIMARLAEILTKLDRKRLPVHITPPVKQMITEIANALPFPTNMVLRQLLRPALTDKVLALLGEAGQTFEPLFHNTVNVTIIRAGDKANVIPSEIEIELDGRLLPGFKPEDIFSELRQLLGGELELELLMHQPGPAEPDMGLYPVLADILHKKDPNGHAIPMVLTAVTDARMFSRLGIQTYGFLPMKLPIDLGFAKLYHAADERIPVDALDFGTQAIFEALQRFGEATVNPSTSAYHAPLRASR